jgi:hypothetical protein
MATCGAMRPAAYRPSDPWLFDGYTHARCAFFFKCLDHRRFGSRLLVGAVRSAASAGDLRNLRPRDY